MALFGACCGAGLNPGSARVRSGRTGGIGSGSRNGGIFGLHPRLHAPGPHLLSKAHALRPFLRTRYPALVRSPILKSSRRPSPAARSSSLFLRALAISFSVGIVAIPFHTRSRNRRGLFPLQSALLARSLQERSRGVSFRREISQDC